MQAVTDANFCPWSVTNPSNSSSAGLNDTSHRGSGAEEEDQTGSGAYDEDDSHREEEEQEAKSQATCNRMQDFHSLVERAEFEHNKELIEGHIRSNSLVFNTFIFLQVRTAKHQPTASAASFLEQQDRFLCTFGLH